MTESKFLRVILYKCIIINFYKILIYYLLSKEIILCKKIITLITFNIIHKNISLRFLYRFRNLWR
jgi:hypothetical protein